MQNESRRGADRNIQKDTRIFHILQFFATENTQRCPMTENSLSQHTTNPFTMKAKETRLANNLAQVDDSRTRARQSLITPEGVQTLHLRKQGNKTMTLRSLSRQLNHCGQQLHKILTDTQSAEMRSTSRRVPEERRGRTTSFLTIFLAVNTRPDKKKNTTEF